MTSISTSPAPTPPAPAPTEAAGGAGKAPEARDGQGFMALIDALLQGSTLPAEVAAEPAFGLVADADGADEPAGDDEQALDLLAGMGFSPVLPSLAQPSLPPAESVSGASGTRQAALTDAQAALLTASGDADDESLLAGDALFAAIEDAAPDDASATSRGGPDARPELNAWASVTHRLAGTQAAAAAAEATGQAGLREDVGTARWKDELGARITLMATQGQQSGSLRLSPEHLGPLEIEITVNDDKTTNVQFGAQHADTRAALQDALPRLRELFATAGLMLGDAGVSGQAPRQRPTDDGVSRMAGNDGRDGEPTPLQRPVRSITHSGLLDTYA